MKSFTSLIAILILGFVQVHAQKVIDEDFFNKTDQFLKAFVADGLIDYAHAGDDATFKELVETIEQADLSSADKNTKIAFYINAYNLMVINRVADNYPLESVFSEVGFFGANKIVVEGKKISLNTVEKEYLLKGYPDARYHFVLVCGALGCPPITTFAYRPEQLEEQLESQTKIALNNPSFIQVDDANNSVELSQIFKWYKDDFGGSDASALAYVNKYRDTKIPETYDIGFYTYDWALNEQKTDMPFDKVSNNNAARYVVSSTIPKGTIETRSFYSLYTQAFETSEGNRLRSNFFTAWYSAVYGISNTFNAGLDLRYRRVSNTNGDVSPLQVFGNQRGSNGRGVFSTIGPKIRWAPTQYLPNFSVQSAFWIPIAPDLEGNENQPFVDWDGPTWWTQLFNDIPIGSNFSLFTELDFLIEDIGGADDLNRFSTPVTGIISYFPNPKTTIYLLANYSPFWQEDFDYFGQAGIGFKYQFTPQAELELLYTSFTNEFLANNPNGVANTFNIGFRFNR